LFALLPAFVLGATDPDEAAFVRRHLTDAPGAEAELAAYTRLVDVLHFSAPLATPPPALEARLRAALTADPVHTQAAPSPIGRGRSWHWPRLALAAAAAMAVLLALNLWWTDQMTGLRTENAALQSQVTAQATALALQQDQLTTQQQQLDALYYQEAKLGRTIASQIDLLAQVVAVAGESYDMPPAQSDSPAFATVAWLDQPGVGVLRADNFPPLPPDMVYQFWLIKDGARTSGGLFTVDDAGRGSLIFTPGGSLDDFDGMGVTPEPAGGSDGPTSPPVVTATLQHG
jgi:anti-sigma-K factor RskA